MMVSVGDVRLFVDVDGPKLVPDGESMRERPTIVMLHGNGGDHSWADDLVALCDAMGIDRPVIYGLSFGGNIALNYAIRYPDHPAKLVVVCCAARINPDASIRMYERLGGPDVGAVASRFYAAPADTWDEFLPVCGPYFSPEPRREQVVARMVVRPGVTEHILRHEYLQHDYRDCLAEIRCPTLLLGGELDPISPIEEIEDTARRMRPGLARVVRFPDSGHGTAGVRDEVVELVRDFVLEDA